MSKIELGLHEHHAAYQASNPPTASGSGQGAMGRGSATTDQGLIETSFAKVNSVAPGSPADDAGLKAGDRILKFGDINSLNHEKLSKVAETVQRNQGVSLCSPLLLLELSLIWLCIQRNLVVKVVRHTEELTLQLIPRSNWGGRGLLGCHLLPT